MENEEVVFTMANITPLNCRDVDYMNDQNVTVVKNTTYELVGQILIPGGTITWKFLMRVFKFSDIILIFMLNVI